MIDSEKVAKQWLFYGWSIMGSYIFSRYLCLAVGKEHTAFFVSVFLYCLGNLLIIVNKHLKNVKIKTETGRRSSYILFVYLYMWLLKDQALTYEGGGIEILLFFPLGVWFKNKKMCDFMRYVLIVVSISIFFCKVKRMDAFPIGWMVCIRLSALTLGYWFGRKNKSKEETRRVHS